MNNIPVTTLRGVGPRVAELLAKLDIYTVEDLLFHLPLHYQDRTVITPIRSLRIGEQKLIEGVVQSGKVQYPGRRVLSCHLTDDTGSIVLNLYHFNPAQQKQLTRSGTRLRCFGAVRYNHRQHRLEMIHPEYKVITAETPFVSENYWTPVYPITKGLSQHSLQKLITQALAFMEKQACEDLLPTDLRAQFHLPTLPEAIYFLHRLPKEVSLEALKINRHPMQQRLALEELIAQQIALQQYRHQIQAHRAPALIAPAAQEASLWNKLLPALPYSLTAAQQRVIHEIHADIAQPVPMMRLLQGDVGAGKTIVAIAAILRAVDQGYQAAFMAPTELLADQHFQVLKKWLTPLSINIGLLTGNLGAAKREEALQRMANHTDAVIVGTHALFQQEVQFANLALIIIDEQHRFGVHQRLALKEKGFKSELYPHQLIMTATPIPRTLAMTAYADLDVSILDELPPGRKPIHTALIANDRRDALIERIKQNCQQGRQAYWVCTLIADSEILDCQAAEVTYELLTRQLPTLRIGLLHGRLNKDVKETTMAAFKAGEIDLLVATTVIEVGVDVPNASLMVIENAERLGLSQLHQLRGRVGRGNQESHCVMLYQKPLSALAKIRLTALRDSQDGFKIAQTDLEIRGPGEWLGTRQAGLPAFRIADIARDQYLLPQAKQAAVMLVKQHPQLASQLLERWLKGAKNYATV